MRFVLAALVGAALTLGVIALVDLDDRVTAIEEARAAQEPTASLPTPFDPSVFDELDWPNPIPITFDPPWRFPDGTIKPR